MTLPSKPIAKQENSFAKPDKSIAKQDKSAKLKSILKNSNSFDNSSKK